MKQKIFLNERCKVRCKKKMVTNLNWWNIRLHNVYYNNGIKRRNFSLYTRCITPKRVKSWRGPRFFQRNVAVMATVGNTVFDLAGPRFEPQTSSSGDERVTARPTGR